MKEIREEKEGVIEERGGGGGGGERVKKINIVKF